MRKGTTLTLVLGGNKLENIFQVTSAQQVYTVGITFQLLDKMENFVESQPVLLMLVLNNFFFFFGELAICLEREKGELSIIPTQYLCSFFACMPLMGCTDASWWLFVLG